MDGPRCHEPCDCVCPSVSDEEMIIEDSTCTGKRALSALFFFFFFFFLLRLGGWPGVVEVV
jgi:hypothetical protein